MQESHLPGCSRLVSIKMVLACGKDKMVPPEKYSKHTHVKASSPSRSSLSYLSSEYPSILWVPALFKNQRKWNTKLAKSQIRRKFCLEIALGKITHTCMRPETGKQMREYREEPLQCREHGHPGQQGMRSQMLRGHICGVPAHSLAASGYWDWNGKWDFFLFQILGFLSINHRTWQNTLLEFVLNHYHKTS